MKEAFRVESIHDAGVSARAWDKPLQFGPDGKTQVVRMTDGKGREIEAHMIGCALLNVYFVDGGSQ